MHMCTGPRSTPTVALLFLGITLAACGIPAGKQPAGEDRDPPAADGDRAAAGQGRLAVVLPDRDSLALVDPQRGVVAEIGVGASLWGVAVAGDRAYVSAARHVTVDDLPSRRVVARVAYRTPIEAVERGEHRAGGMGIAAGPGGRRIYVGVNRPGRGRMEVLDARSLGVVGDAPVGRRPFDVLISRDGASVYTVDHDSYARRLHARWVAGADGRSARGWTPPRASPTGRTARHRRIGVRHRGRRAPLSKRPPPPRMQSLAGPARPGSVAGDVEEVEHPVDLGGLDPLDLAR